MSDEERAAKIEALLLKFSRAMERKAVLVSDAKEFEAKLGDIRRAFGNSYFYCGGPARAGVIDVNRELGNLTEQLRALGVTGS